MKNGVLEGFAGTIGEDAWSEARQARGKPEAGRLEVALHTHFETPIRGEPGRVDDCASDPLRRKPFAILRYLTHSRLSFNRPGLTAGVFLIGYAMARIFVEFFKEWDYGQFFTTAYFSEGMIYSLPMILFGLYLIGHGMRRRVAAA